MLLLHCFCFLEFMQSLLKAAGVSPGATVRLWMGQGMSWIASHTPGSVHISEFKEVAYRQCAKNLKNKQRQTGTLWWMSDQQSRRGRRRGEAEWVVSHGDVFSLKLFEHCNQNLLWHQAYNSIYPRLLFFFLYLPFPLSAICPLSCWMSNIQRRLRCRLLLRSVCVCVCWVGSSAGGFHLYRKRNYRSMNMHTDSRVLLLHPGSAVAPPRNIRRQELVCFLTRWAFCFVLF